MTRKPIRLVSALVAGVLAFGLSGCGSDNPITPATTTTAGAGGEIIVGSADFTENVILAEIYKGALASTGAKVSIKPQIGSREVVVRALQDKSLSVVPEYTGNLLAYLDKSATQTDPDEVYEALKSKVPSGLTVLKMSSAQDSDVLTVTQQTAQQQNLSTLEDLGPKCGEFVLGAAAEWKQRWETKIKELYGCTFKEIRTTDAGGPLTVGALKNGDVQVANLFTTLSAVKANNFVLLEDTKHMYPAQNVVPFGRTDALNDAAKAALDKVSEALTTEKLTDLVAAVELQRKNAADVAADFLKEAGF